MTTFDQSQVECENTRRGTARPRWIDAVSNFLRGWRNRRAFYRLSDMSDGELSDIGLTRTDLHVSASHPFGIDPTVRLGMIVRARTEAGDRGAKSSRDQ